MTIYDELVARGLIAQVTDEEEITDCNDGCDDGVFIIRLWQ